MDRREPPPTAEGWYALHDMRAMDWAAWQGAPERVRQRAVDEATELLSSATAVENGSDGASALYAVAGHKADLLMLHLRPTLADVERLERRFERTELAGFTEQTDSFVSVTEASGYSERTREYFEGEVDEDSGLAQYIRSRLYPEIPDAEHVSFYPMDKRRDPDQNWYDLPFEERADHVADHGEIGRDYAGRVRQMITGSIGMDDWEWGVTLWADDLTDVKDLLYEMRFDPSTSRFAEFGTFYVGRRFPPSDLGAYLAGEHVPTDDDFVEESGGDEPSPAGEPATVADGAATSQGHDTEGGDESDESDSADGRPPTPGDAGDVAEVDDLDRRLADFGVFPTAYDDGDHGLVCYVEGDAEDVLDDVEGLRENFEHYDTHVLTSVRADQGQAAVLSVWETGRAATTAAGFLTDVDAVSQAVRGTLGDANGDAAAESDTGDAPAGTGDDNATAVRDELAEQGVYAGQPHGEDVYALVLYSRADADRVVEAMRNLRAGFAGDDTHVKTAVYGTGDGVRIGDGNDSDGSDDESSGDESSGDESGVDESGGEGATAVVSLWETADAANRAADDLTALPDVVGRPADRDGFTTLGMFYTVKPDYREEFVDTFQSVGEHLAGMDGHRETALLVNREDDADMFVASRWDAREDAMAFFRSDEFRETVDWGREVLADEPRHVFLV